MSALMAGAIAALSACVPPDETGKRDDTGRAHSASPRDTANADTAAVDTGSDPDTAAASIDADGDGYTTNDGDCDDANPDIHPGAAEVPGDDVDEDCDGRDGGDSNIWDIGARYDGSAAKMGFGEVIVLRTARDGERGELVISEPAREVGQAGGYGLVNVYDGSSALAGGPTKSVLHYPRDTANFGEALALVSLPDTRAAWIVGLSDINVNGGWCAFDTLDSGELRSESDAVCPPPFEDEAYDRASTRYSGAADVDGDGIEDLVISGFTGVKRTSVGALWLVRGPLDWAVLGELPDLGMAGFVSSPVVHDVGDVTGDGRVDLALEDGSADGEAKGSGRVYLLAGSIGIPPSASEFASIDGNRPDASTGSGVAAPDLDADGQPDLCVAASLDDTVGDRAGRVGCFYGPISGNQPLSSAPVTWLAGEANSFFGAELAAIDADGDGDGELLVAETGDPYFGAPKAGRVHLVDHGSTAPLVTLVGDVGDLLGYALATGDLDGDGLDDLAVGAPNALDGQGSAYVISGASGAW